MKSQAKILFVITQGLWGGAQKYVLDLALHSSHTHEVFLAVQEQDTHIFEQKIKSTSSKITLCPLKHLRREISPLHDILAIFELHALYKRLRPDIVHLNSSKAGVIGSLARTTRTHILYTAHGWVFLEPLSFVKKTLYKYLEWSTAHLKDACIVLSEADKKVAQDILHIPQKKIFTIPLGISKISLIEKNAARHYLTNKQASLPKNKIWVGTIANHYKTKGLDILIEAVHLLEPRIQKQLAFVIIGNGPERPTLTHLIKQYNLENTIFLQDSIADASQFLLAFDFFVLPSRKEGLPYTLIEALQAGLPIIATDVGGVSTLFSQTDNILIPPLDPGALKKAIMDMLQNTQHSPSISEKNKKESTKYSLSNMILLTERVYQNYFE